MDKKTNIENPNKFSFVRDLWNKFDTVKIHSQERRKMMEDFTNVIEEIAVIEEQYSKKLHWVIQQFEKLQQVRGNHLCSHLFDQMKIGYIKQSNENESLSKSIKQSIGQKLKTMIQYQNQEAKQIISQGKEIQDNLFNKTQEIEKWKLKYVKSVKENEEFSIIKNIFSELKHFPEEKTKKYNQKQQQSEINLKQNQQKYQESLSKYNDYLPEYYKNLAIILEKLEDQEEQRCSQIHSSLFELLNFNQAYRKNSSHNNENILNTVTNIELNEGTQQFIKQNTSLIPLFSKQEYYPLITFNTISLQDVQEDLKNNNKKNDNKNNENNKNNSNLIEEGEMNKSKFQGNTDNQYSQLFYEIIKNQKLPDPLPEDLQNLYKLKQQPQQQMQDDNQNIKNNDQNQNQQQENNKDLQEGYQKQENEQNNEKKIEEEQKNEQDQNNQDVQDNKKNFLYYPDYQEKIQELQKNLKDESKCIQIAKYVLDAYKGYNFSQVEQYQFAAIIESEEIYRYLFVQCFSQFRIQGKKILSPAAYEQKLKLLIIVLNNCMRFYDYKLINKIMVLSLSYHKIERFEMLTESQIIEKKERELLLQENENEDKLQNEQQQQQQQQEQEQKGQEIKVFLQEGIITHNVWKLHDYWETSIFKGIIEQLRLQKSYIQDNEETLNQTSQREKSILFAQISFQVENMILFHHPLEQIKNLTEKYTKLFELPKDQIQTINERIKDYEAEKGGQQLTYESVRQAAKNFLGL